MMTKVYSALLTVKRFITDMNPLMLCQLGAACKGLFTFFTLIRFLASMDALVPRKV